MTVKSPELNVVTGAFSHTGKYMTRRLLSMGKRIRTVTGHPNRKNPFGDQVAAFALNFGNVAALTDSLRGATTLYNTYWVRFPYGDVTFDKALENTKMLIKAAEEAGVYRLVHISITNACEDSPLPYFKGKGLVEKAIIHSRLSYAIIRPTVIFGPEDILINNIAWLLRKFPLFAVPRRGDYRIQPIYAEDVAEIAVNTAQDDQNMIVDAVGPETYTFEELVRTIAEKIRSRGRIVHVHPELVLLVARLVGRLVKDVVLTTDEIKGLMSGLLVSGGRPMGKMRFSEWLEHNANTVGIRYASELNQHYR